MVDEEHDSSYKQFDPAPRYNARDAAIYLASQSKAKVLLGSATPSIESYLNAKNDKYSLFELKKRYTEILLPEIEIVDIKKGFNKGKTKTIFSEVLLKEMKTAFENDEQIILFQNRRGFSLRLECDICHWMPECKFCDVTLTYHKSSNALRCHYCGYSEKIPQKCKNCGNTRIITHGFGTEKVEDELEILFHDKKIVRMDMDSTRTKHAHQRIIQDFEDRRIDVLVGTQMVTKGLDFSNVSLVGILNADNMINFPDFRSFERSFQLMVQVSGRAGRKNKRGKVIIQTYNPKHNVLKYVKNNDFTAMFAHQISERLKYNYPPFYRLIKISLKHKNEESLLKPAAELARDLRRIFGKRVLGPEYPLVRRIRSYYIKNILLKLERKKNLNQMKSEVLKIIESFSLKKDNKSIRIVIDVDPI